MAGEWEERDPIWDRVAGAMVGGAVAPVLAGREAGPDDGREYARGVGALVTGVLRGLADEGRDPGDGWSRALRATVLTGEVPAPGAGSGPSAVGWGAAATAPAPGLDAARGVFPCAQLVTAVRAAHGRGGVEAARYAGALAGARWGVSGVPLAAQRAFAAVAPPRRLVTEALVAVRGDAPEQWPQKRTQVHPTLDRENRRTFAVPHPYDPGVTLCNMEYVRDSADAEAVVSLCRMGADDRPRHLAPGDVVEVWLHDSPGANPNLHFVLDDAARAVAAMRAEGKRVLLHCAACQSRTPAVAARYASLTGGADVVRALRTVIETVAGHLDNPELSRAAAALDGVDLADPPALLFPDGLPALTRTPRS
ncbi:protein-tyrosine phosphatase [Actinorugispora endophytica]|uniref:Protein-tyrosine phosphatase n=2 Tax=Actinorugispora endophytica TaxID=1605990 RepID=A0A4R6V7F9_9ACTN|nr:protein-tyrosine phosphatase [Actinorugispora endophytica]